MLQVATVAGEYDSDLLIYFASCPAFSRTSPLAFPPVDRFSSTNISFPRNPTASVKFNPPHHHLTYTQKPTASSSKINHHQKWRPKRHHPRLKVSPQLPLPPPLHPLPQHAHPHRDPNLHPDPHLPPSRQCQRRCPPHSGYALRAQSCPSVNSSTC
jgi:hypothetical protein